MRRDEFEDHPICCGEKATYESFRFYTCRKCGGEISYNFEGQWWDFDCPRADPPRRDLG